jgi:aryl-alcohol dehydrogenase-like predicted oxidoreductase
VVDVARRIVLGCGNFGGIGSAPELYGRGETEEEASLLMDAAWELGLRWFDTADAYGGGRSERAIGKWIARTGNRPRLTTKTFNPMEPGGDSGLGRDRVLRQIESSLERLGVDSVEVYLAHEFDAETPLAETIDVFDELAERRLIASWGVSNVDVAQLETALAIGRPAYAQNSYSLLERRDEDALLPLCEERGVAYQAFSPLAGGWLTGKYRRSEPPPQGSRMTLRPGPYRHLERDSVYEGLERLAAAASALSVSTAALALAWVLSHPAVDSAVIGPRRPAHLEPVVEAMRIQLSTEERDELGSLFSA